MIANEGLVTLEMVCKDLQRMIRDEAKLHGKGGRPDYTATFRLFDVDENDHISTIEFKNMLIRLRLADSLPDAQMPKLIEKFDKKNKGYIAFEDFIGFIESHKDLLNEDDYDDSNVVFDTADEDKTLALKSSVPPAAVTRDADCDWLLWHLWRRANKIDAADPEAVISELENSCAEAELIQQRGNVTVGELWDIFHDLKLMGDLARPQYEKGLKYLLMEGTGKDSDEVDYESLCRYTIRMGRAYNEMMQESLIVDEKKYKELKTELKKELVAYGMVVGSRGEKIYKFDKVFRRVDSDGDGQVTMQELKSGMKKIKLKGEKFWSLKMLRRMFYEVDKDHSGTISLKEFSEFVQNPNNDEVLRYDPTTDKLSTGISKPPLGKDQRDKLNRADSDDDDFADFRGGTGGINDVELYRKVGYNYSYCIHT